MSLNDSFNKNNLDNYLNELSKEYKRLGGRKQIVDVLLVGGCAIVANYNFRETTTDIDAQFPKVSILKEAINKIADKYNLSNSWLNDDFIYTSSYSSKLARYSKHYKKFNQVLNVQTIDSESSKYVSSLSSPIMLV